MKSLKIAFCILLCVTILSVGASVVCAVIAGNVAESFRDYRSSVITTLSSLHAQLNSSKQAFADALTYLDGTNDKEDKTEHAMQTLPTPDQPTEMTEQDSTEPLQTQPPTQDRPQSPVTLYTVREVDGRIGIYDQDGALVKTLSVPVATLPRADREQLAVGITVTSEHELDALIEDFSG